MKRALAIFAFVGILAAPACGQWQPGGSLPVHNHSGPNDGGLLSNLNVLDSLRVATAPFSAGPYITSSTIYLPLSGLSNVVPSIFDYAHAVFLQGGGLAVGGTVSVSNFFLSPNTAPGINGTNEALGIDLEPGQDTNASDQAYMNFLSSAAAGSPDNVLYIQTSNNFSGLSSDISLQPDGADVFDLTTSSAVFSEPVRFNQSVSAASFSADASTMTTIIMSNPNGAGDVLYFVGRGSENQLGISISCTSTGALCPSGATCMAAFGTTSSCSTVVLGQEYCLCYGFGPAP